MIDPADNPPPKVIAFVNARGRKNPETGQNFFVDDEFGGAVFDISKPGCPNITDPREFIRWTVKHRPELWEADPHPEPQPEKAMSLAEQWWRTRYQMDEPAPTAATAPKAITAPETPPALAGMAASMAAVKRDEISVADAVAQHLGARASAAAAPPTQPPTLNFSNTMAAARRGDAQALARLNDALSIQGSVR